VTFREHSGNQRTFREHFGNIQEQNSGNQGTIKEQQASAKSPNLNPRNIQGIFREHSERVERTPVSLHPNCKKHFKKVLRSTQNTTCKHEYLRPNNVSQE
jgi:hypothetical protein